jgi:uncharacterized membrane protein YphA (DoxX/SURF4 family)
VDKSQNAASRRPKDERVNDWKRISLIGAILIVLLRLSIGWQFLYEGIWKYDSLKSPTPWTAEGYLKQAQGPFRETFRNMTGDPDDLGWLDYDTMSARWDEWKARFATHYRLDEPMRAELDKIVDGPPAHAARLVALPAGVDLSRVTRSGAKLTYDATNKQLVLDAATPLKPDEVVALKAQVAVEKDADGNYVTPGTTEKAADADVAFYKAIETLDRNGSRLSYRKRLLGALKGDPEKVGVTARADKNSPSRYSPEMGTVVSGDDSTDLVRYGEIQVYKDMLKEYNDALAKERKDSVEFQQQHLDTLWSKIQAKRAELVGPIKALDKSLKDEATRMLNLDQLKLGQPPRENSPLTKASDRAMWGLLIIGILLLAGLGTRVAAVAGAVMLLSFYLVVPPWPGVPQPPSPEHSLIINKNLIEVLALLAIAALPTGSWFGLDGILRWVFRRKKAR